MILMMTMMMTTATTRMMMISKVRRGLMSVSSVAQLASQSLKRNTRGSGTEIIRKAGMVKEVDGVAQLRV